MKKLILTAAVAAIASGAFALCGETETVQAVIVKAPARTVYTFNFSGKTTKGAESAAVINMCGEAGESCIARIPTKLKIKGWVALCEGECTAIMDSFAAPAAYAFWEIKPYKADIPDATLNVDVLNIIGKKPTKAEMHGALKGTVTYAADYTWDLADGLVYAGFGKYNKKTGVYSKISGNFAGSPVASWYIGNGADVCAQTSPYLCTTLALDCENKPNTVAFGKWNMKYSKSGTKKLYKGSYPKTPSYATVTVSE